MTQVQSRNFMVHICNHCRQEFEAKEGDVIFGDKWFHQVCWMAIKMREDLLGEKFNDSW